MKLPFDQEWIMLEREDYANYFFVYSTWEGYSALMEQWGFANGRYMGAHFIDGACELFMPLRFFNKINDFNYQLLFNEPQKWDELHAVGKAGSDQLFDFGKKLLAKNPEKLSNAEISDVFEDFFALQNLVHVPRGAIWQIETPKNILNNYLHSYLEEQKEDNKPEVDINEAFRTLITPLEENILQREKRELAEIALLGNPEEQAKALDAHAKKYEWLEFGLQGKILSKDYFRDSLSKISQKLEAGNEGLKEKQAEYVRLLKIGDAHQRIFQIVRDSLAIRLYSKYAQFFGYYALEPILKELSRRYGLTVEELRFLSLPDLKQLLSGDRSVDFQKLAQEHKKKSVQISDRGVTKIYLGAEADEVMSKMRWHQDEGEVKDTQDIRGQVAFKGKVKGRVKIINTVSEIAKMHAGNVLVSHMTNPDIVAAMKLAAAIVTDLGGITCHAAIVARELGVPCIIGTKIATKILRDGDHVEVDAEKGVVKILG